MQSFRSKFRYHYPPVVFLAAVVYARLRVVEQVPGPSSTDEQRYFYQQARQINQYLEAGSDDPRNQGRPLNRIARLTGYLLLKEPNTIHFQGGDRFINSIPPFPTAEEVGHWLGWNVFRKIFTPLVSTKNEYHNNLPLTGKAEERQARCIAWGLQLLLECGTSLDKV